MAGSIVIRMSEEQRELVHKLAAKEDFSLNTYCLLKLGIPIDQPQLFSRTRRARKAWKLAEDEELPQVTFCPLHRLPVLAGNGGKCIRCEEQGMRAETCELDKINRVIDTLQEQGEFVDIRRSYAVIVVYNEEPKADPPCETPTTNS